MYKTLRLLFTMVLALTTIVSAKAIAATAQGKGHPTKLVRAPKRIPAPSKASTPTKAPSPTLNIADHVYTELVSMNASLRKLPNGPNVPASDFPKYFDKTAVSWLTAVRATSIRRSGSHIELERDRHPFDSFSIKENQASVYYDSPITGDLDEDPNQISLYWIGEHQISEYYSGLEADFGTQVKHIAVKKLPDGKLRIMYTQYDDFNSAYNAYDIDASGKIEPFHSK